MFLIAEDCTRDRQAGIAAETNDPLGARLAELAAVLALRKPELDLDDVARLLEVLADRHFTTSAEPPIELPSAAIANTWLMPAAAPPVLAELAAGMARSQTIRLVNFHATPRYREAEFRRQIEALSHAFEPVTPANFAEAMEGRWSHERPGLMPALFEGYRDNLDVMLPILEEFGFTGWLFVPSGFLNVPAEEQRGYAAQHTLHLPAVDEYPGERYALSWDEARDIVRRGHAFACHTRSHFEVTPDTSREVLENEIIAAKIEMERELGTRIESFCWLEGAELGVNPEADDMLRQAGFRYLFSNFKVQKLQ
ncbi:polysaccharide deacetylase family protein [Sphingomonas sp.]|uniref:polysaccharide deacetylase family protein n=1 Tax=Sphingomonas sp. TaxID=28214 RepID=UPI003B000389